MKMENGLNFMIQRIKIELRKNVKVIASSTKLKATFVYEISC
jgi:hypothetical protein